MDKNQMITILHLRLQIYDLITSSKYSFSRKSVVVEEVFTEIEKFYSLLFNDGARTVLEEAIRQEDDSLSQLDVSLDIPFKNFVQYLHLIVEAAVTVWNTGEEQAVEWWPWIDKQKIEIVIQLSSYWIVCYTTHNNQEIQHIDEGLFSEITSLFKLVMEKGLQMPIPFPCLLGQQSSSTGVYLDLMWRVSLLFKHSYESLSPSLSKRLIPKLCEIVLPIVLLVIEREKHEALSLQSPYKIFQEIVFVMKEFLHLIFFTPKNILDLFSLKLTALPSECVPGKDMFIGERTQVEEEIREDQDKKLSSHKRSKRPLMEYLLDAVVNIALTNSFPQLVKWEWKIDLVIFLWNFYLKQSEEVRDEIEETSVETSLPNAQRRKRKYFESVGKEIRVSRLLLARKFHFPLILINRIENAFFTILEQSANHSNHSDQLVTLLFHVYAVKVELLTNLKKALDGRFIPQHNVFSKYYQYLENEFEIILQNVNELIFSVLSNCTDQIQQALLSVTFVARQADLHLNVFNGVKLLGFYIKHLHQIQLLRPNYSERDLMRIVQIFFHDQFHNIYYSERNDQLDIAILQSVDQQQLQTNLKYSTSCFGGSSAFILIDYYQIVAEFLLATIELYAQLRDIPLLLSMFAKLANHCSAFSGSFHFITQSKTVQQKLLQTLLCIPSGQWRSIFSHILNLDQLLPVEKSLFYNVSKPTRSTDIIPPSQLDIYVVVIMAGLELQMNDFDLAILLQLQRDILILLNTLYEQFMQEKANATTNYQIQLLNLSSLLLQFGIKSFGQHLFSNWNDTSSIESSFPHLLSAMQNKLSSLNQSFISSIREDFTLSNYIVAVVKKVLTIYQYFINLHRFQNSHSLSETGRDRLLLTRDLTNCFFFAISFVSDKFSNLSVLRVYSCLLQTMLHWSEAVSASPLTSQSTYPVFILGLRTTVECIVRKQCGRAFIGSISLVHSIALYQEEQEIMKVASILKKSQTVEFSGLEECFIGEFNRICVFDDLNDQAVAFKSLFSLFSKDFYVNMIDSNVNTLLSGLTKCIDAILSQYLAIEASSDIFEALLSFSVAVNNCLLHRIRRNSRALAENKPLFLLNVVDSSQLVVKISDFLFTFWSLHYSFHLCEEIELLLHSVIVLLFPSQQYNSGSIDEFFNFPLILMASFIRVFPAENFQCCNTNYQSFVRVVHFSFLHVLEIIKEIIQKTKDQFVASRLLTQFLRANYDSFYATIRFNHSQKLFGDNRSEINCFISGIISEISGMCSSCYELLFKSLEGAKRLLFRRLLRISERKIIKVRLSCAELILSLLNSRLEENSHSPIIFCGFNFLLSSVNVRCMFKTLPSTLAHDQEETILPHVAMVLLEKLFGHATRQLLEYFKEKKDVLDSFVLTVYSHPVVLDHKRHEGEQLTVSSILSVISTLFTSFIHADMEYVKQDAQITKVLEVYSSLHEQLINGVLTLEVLHIRSSTLSLSYWAIIRNFLTFTLSYKVLHQFYDEHSVQRGEINVFVYWKVMEYFQTQLFISANHLSCLLSMQLKEISQEERTKCLSKLIYDLSSILRTILKPTTLQFNAAQLTAPNSWKELSLKHVKFFSERSLPVVSAINDSIAALMKQQTFSVEPGSIILFEQQLELLHILLSLTNRSLIPNILTKLTIIQQILVQALRIFPFFLKAAGPSTQSSKQFNCIELFNRIMHIMSGIKEYEKQFFIIFVAMINELRNPNYQHYQFFAGLFPLYSKLLMRDKNRSFQLLDSTGKELLNQFVAEYRRIYRYDETN